MIKPNEPRIDTNLHEFERENLRSDVILAEEAYAIVGCAFEVLNNVGHGLHEKPYENALVIELGLREIPFVQQTCFNVEYKGYVVGEYVPDLIAFDSVVIDTKVIERITDRERGKMLNYLKITKLRVGLIINFHNPTLEWERIVL